ncbi:hypothetical protein L5515_015721 [Caenorhabditis briggsae]|uniref:Uncharacterized protein n=2 Tax=Caenorhabditis TaxID=6237 RepID=A0AAE9DPF4_CAEBR|nr:hypothetical protein B9Z55_021869 [Caenorhabditis nigoni]ULU08531.1 hypothetical protein L3Y34_019614 [Caenorhabditis briggsae]UMM20450.1 hypothetical protein L5515_015721 [Caenorhabditis briggsae]
MADQIELVRNGGGNSSSTESRPPLKAQLSRQTTLGTGHEITLGTDQDPYNKEELVNTLKGRELGLFVVFYICAVLFIVMTFEFFKPIFFTNNYPN